MSRSKCHPRVITRRDSPNTVMEEAALIDGDALAEVIIPMMNIPRPTADGGRNDEEPHSQQVYIKL